MADQESLREEVKQFNDLWEGGYFEGDPLDPMGKSGYRELGYMSVLHATYLACIKPYVHADSVVLEIGPGRGAWTKCFLNASEVWCLDALPEKHNGFFKYLKQPNNVRYIEITDFSCAVLPDNRFDYLFSFGCFCHISPQGVQAYFTNLYPKLKKGAHAFVQFADYDKYNRALDHFSSLSIERAFDRRLNLPNKILYKLINSLKGRKPQKKDKNENPAPAPGRWYHLGVKEACELLERSGYRVVDPDVGVNHRDPVVHFIKPI